jgi:RND family efflux transporter MFP subunit
MKLRASLSHDPSTPIAALMLLSIGLLPACKKPAPPPLPTEAPAVHVETVEVTAVDAPQSLRLIGTLRGAKETDLAANATGRVLKTYVERGAEVKAGELLAQVDVSAAALSLAEARVQVVTSKTQLDISQADCARYEQLKGTGAISEYEYDQVTSKCKISPLLVKAAQARQSMVAKNVGDGMIRSPFAGVITERFVEVGEYVLANSKIVSLAQIEELRLEFTVPEANFPQVKPNAKVTLHVAAYGEAPFEGKVIHISSAVRPTRDIVVEASVLNADRRLLPGMFANVSLDVGARSLPSIPRSAMFAQNGKENVFVVHEGRLEQRVVRPEPELGGRIPIVKGVALGERVVATHSADLKNGLRVN